MILNGNCHPLLGQLLPAELELKLKLPSTKIAVNFPMGNCSPWPPNSTRLTLILRTPQLLHCIRMYKNKLLVGTFMYMKIALNWTYVFVLQIGTFDWDSVDQGLVLGCYFYGYVAGGIPGAWLSRKLGFRLIVGAATILSSLMTIITPIVAWYKFELLVALRITIGFVQVVYDKEHS